MTYRLLVKLDVFLLVSIKNAVFWAVILLMEETGLHEVVTALHNIPEDRPSSTHPPIFSSDV
jgi:hypothetical protein